ncbi:hypothetical protein FB451DRAFT_137329 [Mycena latifolia]|nr:hypothetical protein FB451DRAFT_137329 [Mycena latifolia]
MSYCSPQSSAAKASSHRHPPTSSRTADVTRPTPMTHLTPEAEATTHLNLPRRTPTVVASAIAKSLHHHRPLACVAKPAASPSVVTGSSSGSYGSRSSSPSCRWFCPPTTTARSAHSSPARRPSATLYPLAPQRPRESRPRPTARGVPAMVTIGARHLPRPIPGSRGLPCQDGPPMGLPGDHLGSAAVTDWYPSREALRLATQDLHRGVLRRLGMDRACHLSLRLGPLAVVSVACDNLVDALQSGSVVGYGRYDFQRASSSDIRLPLQAPSYRLNLSHSRGILLALDTYTPLLPLPCSIFRIYPLRHFISLRIASYTPSLHLLAGELIPPLICYFVDTHIPILHFFTCSLASLYPLLFVILSIHISLSAFRFR